MFRRPVPKYSSKMHFPGISMSVMDFAKHYAAMRIQSAAVRRSVYIAQKCSAES